MTKKYIFYHAIQNKNGTSVPVKNEDWGVQNLPLYEFSGFLKCCTVNLPNFVNNKIRAENFYDDNNVESGYYLFVDDDIELIPFPEPRYLDAMAADPSITKTRELTYLGNV